jgi:hypothetical protein
MIQPEELVGGEWADWYRLSTRPNPSQLRFWFRELRTPEILLELAGEHASVCRRLAAGRPVLADVIRGDRQAIERALLAEETAERARDRKYWLPLLKELEKLRHTG